MRPHLVVISCEILQPGKFIKPVSDTWMQWNLASPQATCRIIGTVTEKGSPPKYLACSDWSAHTHLSQQRSPWLQSAPSCSTVNINISYANVWHGGVVQCQEFSELRARLLMRHFRPLQEQCFLWERGAPIAVGFGLFHFQDFLHEPEPI